MSVNSSGPAPSVTSEGAEPPGELRSQSGEVIEDVVGELVTAGLPADRASVVARLVVTRIHQQSGPLPSVSDFAGYEEVCPGAARDILDMAIRQQQHHHAMDRAELAWEAGLKLIGMAVALLSFAGMIYGAVEAARLGSDHVAIAILTGAGMLGVGGLFLRQWLRPPVEPQPSTPEPNPKARPPKRK